MKKLFAIALALIMLLSAAGLADSSTWLTDEKVTFSVFATVPSSLLYTDDLDNNWFTKYLEDETNIHIDWSNLTYGASGDDSKAKLTTMLASGEYPDLILQSSFDYLSLYQAGIDGVIIPLNDLIEENAPTISKIFEDRPDIKAQWTAPDGNIYGLSMITEYYHGEAPNRLWAYQPWMEQLGFDSIDTTEDFYEYLKAVKETDLNGNGENDEVPLLTMDKLTKIWLINSWIYFDGSNIMNDDGTVKFVSNTEEYREALRYIKRLYEEELIPMDVLTIDGTQIKANMMAEDYKVAVVGAFSFGALFTDLNDPATKAHDMVALAPLEGPEGIRQIPKGTFDFVPNRFSITSACENPELAIAWADWFYDEEHTMTACYGPEITEEQKGEYPGWYSLPDKPGLYWNSQLNADQTNYNNNIAWAQNITVWNMPVTEANKTARMDGTFGWTEAKYAESSFLYEPYKVTKAVKLYFMSAEGAQTISEYKTVIDNIVNSNFAAFITGTKDLDNDWDAYLAELDNAGLATYLDVYQHELDLANGK